MPQLVQRFFFISFPLISSSSSSVRRRAYFCGLFSALAMIDGSGLGGMTAVSVADIVVVVNVDSFRGHIRFKYDNCVFLCLMELSSKICAACG